MVAHKNLFVNNYSTRADTRLKRTNKEDLRKWQKSARLLRDRKIICGLGPGMGSSRDAAHFKHCVEGETDTRGQK